ncbi:MAG: inositol 2-dehydrogenase, partial [Gemmatimonadetes bacterium]|nr:inositol 2-dehydrogenase [Gemmatimonadota bacterium]
MKNLRVGVVGCGGRGRGHMRLLDSFADTDLVAVCDPFEES